MGKATQQGEIWSLVSDQHVYEVEPFMLITLVSNATRNI